MSSDEPIRLVCAGCGARFNLKAASLPERALPCRKCGEPLERADEPLGLKGEPEQRTWEIPVRLGKFIVLGEIARGGMGVVYKARQEGLDRVVAIKMMLPGPASSPDMAERFRREARAAAKLRHPGIVAIHEIGDYKGAPFFSMDFVEGRSLDALLAEGPPKNPAEAARLVRDIARAVHYAHQQGIVHRDLKPGNVMIDPEGVPRVTDFGLAKELDSKSVLSITGDVLGTPAYMPPEQAEGRVREIDGRSDVYSLGAILYRMLTGAPPFEGATVAATIYRVVNGFAAEPRSIEPRIPIDLSAICMKALEKEKEKRYTTAEDLAQDLDRFVNGEPVLAKPISAWGRLARKARRHRTAFRVSAASIGVAVAALLALLFFGGENYLEMVERNLGSGDVNQRRQTLAFFLDDLSTGKLQGEERREARELLEKAFARDADEETRRLVLSRLRREGAGDVVVLVVPWLGKREPKDLTVETLDLLAHGRVKEAADAVIGVLPDPDHGVHGGAIRYFLAAPDLRAFEGIARWVTCPECGEQARAAIRTLYDNRLMSLLSPGTARIGGAVAELGKAVEDYNRQMQQFDDLLPTGKNRPKDAVETASAALASHDPMMRLRAAVELGMHKDGRAGPALLKACRDGDDRVARVAGAALRDCGAAGHADELLGLLDDGRPAVRIAAAAALADVGTDKVVSALAGRLQKEKDPEVRGVLRRSISSDR